jgi:hypothetical protein
MAGNTNVSSLIPSNINDTLNKVEKVEAFGDQIPNSAKSKLKISSLGKEADLRSQILKTTGDIIKLDLNHVKDKATIAIQRSQSSEEIYNKYFPRFPGKPLFAEKAKNKEEYDKESSESNLKFSNGEVIFDIETKEYIIIEPEILDERGNKYPAGLFQIEEKNYLNAKKLLQEKKADLQQKLEDILNDPYKRVKKQRERRQKRVKERKQRNKKKRERGKKGLFKKVLKNARKSLTPIVALQGVRLLFDIILNNKKLQDLVDNTNAVIDAATTQQDINAARALRNSTLSILNDSERKVSSLLTLVERLNIIISALNIILSIALTIFLIPTPSPAPDVVTPAKERFRKRYEIAVKLVDGLNVLVAIFQGILDDQLSELNDLKNQLKDINDLLDNTALNNISDNQLQDFINNLKNQPTTFPEYKGFKFVIKEEETLGAQQAIVVRGNIKRRYAVAIDRDGVGVLKSEFSFTLDPADLIEQLKLIIDQQNLQG